MRNVLVDAARQIGGCLGIALLNTTQASTPAAAVAANSGDGKASSGLLVSASPEGCQRAFFVGA